MPERTILAHPGSGLNTVVLREIERTPFNGGGRAAKERIKAYLGNESGNYREIHLVERKGLPSPDQWLERWKAFKRAGLPVVGTMRVTDEGGILMTDIKADGSETYGKGLYLLLSGDREDTDVSPRKTTLDQRFKQLVNENIHLIEAEVDRLVGIANRNKISLPWDFDAFELLVHPDGTWQLITLDLESADLNVDYAEGLNSSNGQAFIKSLKDIRDLL